MLLTAVDSGPGRVHMSCCGSVSLHSFVPPPMEVERSGSDLPPNHFLSLPLQSCLEVFVSHPH